MRRWISAGSSRTRARSIASAPGALVPRDLTLDNGFSPPPRSPTTISASPARSRSTRTAGRCCSADPGDDDGPHGWLGGHMLAHGERRSLPSRWAVTDCSARSPSSSSAWPNARLTAREEMSGAELAGASHGSSRPTPIQMAYGRMPSTASSNGPCGSRIAPPDQNAVPRHGSGFISRAALHVSRPGRVRRQHLLVGRDDVRPGRHVAGTPDGSRSSRSTTAIRSGPTSCTSFVLARFPEFVMPARR